MKKVVERNYLEIKSVTDLKESKVILEECLIQLIKPADFQINKFFYKNVGKKHHWVDRLVWTEKQWIDYVSNDKVKTYVLKKKMNLLVILNLYCIKMKLKLRTLVY